jgi:hypothetical protein
MDRNTCRVAGVVTAAVLLACLTVAGTGALASRPVVASKSPSQAAVAKKLTKRVMRARTPAARYRALLEVMRTLNVGVFTGKGKPIIRAGKPHDIYLYDFDVKAMAAGLGRKQVMTVSDLAGRLSAGGVTPGGNPLTADKLGKTLAAGTRAAMKHARSRSSLVPLLARELGRKHRPSYDLARSPVGKLRFDPLQTFLIVTDMAAAADGGGGKASLGATAAAGGPCDQQLLDVIKEIMPFGKWTISIIKAVKDQAKIASLLIDMVHGSVLAFSVGFTSTTPNSQATHYGPAGHDGDAGKALDFGVRLVMRDQLPEAIISCGPLLGMKFPNKGPLANVTVAWKDESAFGAPLDDHGTASFPKGRKTDSKGETVLHFEPKVEKVPKFGDVKHAANTKTAVALYQSAFGNVPGSVAQFLTPKSASFAWNIGFHLPRGFKVAGMVHDNDCVMFGKPSCRTDVDIHVCGDDPFAPWDGTITRVSEGDPLTFDVTWAFVPGAVTSPVDKQSGTQQLWIDGRHQLEEPFQTMFTTSGSGGRQGPYTLPIEEDKTCPDNTPVGSG